MPKKFLSPALGVAIAAVLATTAGTCSFGAKPPPVFAPPSTLQEPTNLLPEAIVPFELSPLIPPP